MGFFVSDTILSLQMSMDHGRKIAFLFLFVYLFTF